ncbi:MAG: isochorismatase family protein [Puniceicoccales bacterium]|nr:isochorismatase family protein [Puniceicoccales bacterium]
MRFTISLFPRSLKSPALAATALLAAIAGAASPLCAQDAGATAETPIAPKTGALRVVLQDRLPFKTQLEQDVASLKAEAAVLRKLPGKNSQKLAATASSEAKRLAGKEIPNIPDDVISVRQHAKNWVPSETAVIICDMWDRHWCKHATARVAEMAPFINEFVHAAREKGVRIVHAPSSTLDFYKDHPARLKARQYTKRGKNEWAKNLKGEPGGPGLEARNGGCPECRPGTAWKRQIDTITISNDDFISDNGAEVIGYFRDKGVKNVLLVGVHTNMCVIGRPFGLRAMQHARFNTALVRDLTDLMYNNVIGRETKKEGGGAPYINHFSGLDMQIDYIERYVCPSILSTDITGKKPFRFKEDTRKRVAFLAAESEYRSSQCLQEFGAELNLRGIHADYALGRPIMDGPGRFNLENTQIIDNADLAFVFMRRRALPAAQMDAIRNYLASGRPLVAMRTASHAFAPKGNVPREGGVVEAAKDAKTALDSSLASWPKFDEEVLGGKYNGHYSRNKDGSTFVIVESGKGHPILKDVDFGAEGLVTPNWLYNYTNNGKEKLTSAKATVLIEGSTKEKGKTVREPVLWVNEAGAGTVVYTSFGHWDDWKKAPFRKLLHNTVDHLLAQPRKD